MDSALMPLLHSIKIMNKKIIIIKQVRFYPTQSGFDLAESQNASNRINTNANMRLPFREFAFSLKKTQALKFHAIVYLNIGITNINIFKFNHFSPLTLAPKATHYCLLYQILSFRNLWFSNCFRYAKYLLDIYFRSTPTADPGYGWASDQRFMICVGWLKCFVSHFLSRF